MFVGTKVGEFTVSQRRKLSPALEVEAILEGEIYKETAAAAQDEINASFKSFTEKYGIKTEGAAGVKKAAAKKKGDAADPTSDLIQKIQS